MPRYHANKKTRATTSNTNFFKENIRIVLITIGIGAFAIIAVLTRWQILEHDKWTSIAQSQYTDTQRQTSSRGIIYASDGTILAIDQPTWGVYADLSTDERDREIFFNNKDKYVAEVASILGISREEIEKKLTPDFRYVLLQHNVDGDKKTALEKIRIAENASVGFGLNFEKEEKRVYPDGKLASQVLGFMGKDENGKDKGMYGIEGYYFGDLLTQQGYTNAEKDSNGNIILTSQYDPLPQRQGKSLTLTIMPGIQTKVEKILKANVEKVQAKSGSVIIMEPKTGAILAMANYPDYDPNEYWKVSENWIYQNKAVSQPYEFGSVQKPITIAIGLQSGKVLDDQICNDDKGYLDLPDGTFQANGAPGFIRIYTWNRVANGSLTLSGILEKSNNPCASQVALQTGFQYYYDKLTELGYGKMLGVGLEDESTSYLPPYENWSKIDLAVTSFGQSIAATPLQILTYINSIANDGKEMQPYIVKKVEDSNGDIVEYQPKVLSEPFSKETTDKVKQMMVNVVRLGESRNYFNRGVPDYDIAGKTGTAQIPLKDGAGYEVNKTNTTFVGFSPTKNPKMIMIVKLEEPKTSTFSADTVVPAWIDIYNSIADDLGIHKGLDQ